MTVASENARSLHYGDGSSKSFSVDFVFHEPSSIEVIVIDDDGAEHIQLLNTDYTVSGGISNGLAATGTVLMSVAPALGKEVLIRRKPQITQTFDPIDNEAFLSSSIETALDRLVTQAQYLKDQISRAPLLKAGSNLLGLLELPTPVAHAAIGWNASANGLANVGSSANITAAGAALVGATSYEEMRSTLGLGSAATQNVGTSGANIPLLSTENVWADTQYTASADEFFTAAQMSSTHAGATGGPYLELYRNSPSPTASDIMGVITFSGNDDAGNSTGYCQLYATLTDPTNGSEDARLNIQTVINGSNFVRAYIQHGLVVGAATGGDKGGGSINALAIYDDNVLLTDVVEDFLAAGEIDTDKWDDMVPDIVEPEHRHFRRRTEKVQEQRLVAVSENGRFVAKRLPVIVTRQAIKREDVIDDAGQKIGEVNRPVLDEIVTPEKRTPRRHEMAHRLKKLVSNGLDLRNPRSYIEHLKSTKALPGHIRADEWAERQFSVGEIMNHHILSTEILAAAFTALVEQVERLETKLAKQA